MMSFTCKYCTASFDSQKGLSNHWYWKQCNDTTTRKTMIATPMVAMECVPASQSGGIYVTTKKKTDNYNSNNEDEFCYL